MCEKLARPIFYDTLYIGLELIGLNWSGKLNVWYATIYMYPIMGPWELYIIYDLMNEE